MAWSPPVIFARFHAPPSSEDFAAFIAAAAEEMDRCSTTAPRAVLYHADAHGNVDAIQRKAAAEMLKQRRDKLSVICTGFVFCSTSALARGAMKVVNWLFSPPYPTFEADTVLEGLKILQRVDPRIDAASQLEYYQRLLLSETTVDDPLGAHLIRG